MGKHFGPLQFLVPAVLAIVFLAFASAASGAQNPCSTGVCVSSETIYVLDTDNHRVQTFNGKGVYRSHFGHSFDLPVGIALDSVSNVYVKDGNLNRD